MALHSLCATVALVYAASAIGHHAFFYLHMPACLTFFRPPYLQSNFGGLFCGAPVHTALAELGGLHIVYQRASADHDTSMNQSEGNSYGHSLRNVIKYLKDKHEIDFAHHATDLVSCYYSVLLVLTSRTWFRLKIVQQLA